MTPTYLNPQLFPSPLECVNEDQHQQPFFSPSKPDQSGSSSSSSCAIFLDPLEDQAGSSNGKEHNQQEGGNIFSHMRGSCDHLTPENEFDNGLKFTIWKKQEYKSDEINNSSVKWMSSKMRVMQKMTNADRIPITNTIQKIADQTQPSSPLDSTNSSSSNSFNNNNNPIRVCSDCNTTKTPLWRGGPRGPKSLCNACGIRQRKARRAAAAAAPDGTIVVTDMKKTKGQHKEKKSSTNGYAAQHKKRFKIAAGSSPSYGRKKLCFEDFITISLSKNSAFHQRVFPQDEKEAAILLMALSHDLVHG